jgi:hypothetical protein
MMLLLAVEMLIGGIDGSAVRCLAALCLSNRCVHPESMIALIEGVIEFCEGWGVESKVIGLKFISLITSKEGKFAGASGASPPSRQLRPPATSIGDRALSIAEVKEAERTGSSMCRHVEP